MRAPILREWLEREIIARSLFYSEEDGARRAGLSQRSGMLSEASVSWHKISMTRENGQRENALE